MPVAGQANFDQGYLIFHFQGHVEMTDILDAYTRIFEGVENIGPIDSICIFDKGATLANLSSAALKEVHATAKKISGQAGAERRRSANVMNGSAEAQLIMPLWRAICETDPEVTLDVRLFDKLEQACEWLGLDADSCKSAFGKLIDRPNAG